MEFRRITGLPPYVLGIMNALKEEARRAGEDIIDLGFGNPDIPSPDIAVEKLAEAARNPRNHRYSSSRGIPKLRLAVSDLYERRFGVELDPETQICTTIGAKDGLARAGWAMEKPRGTMFVWAPIPEPYEELGSLDFAKLLVRDAKVAVSPGVGFGPGGEGFVRFALVENEQRIGQAVRGIRRALTKL